MSAIKNVIKDNYNMMLLKDYLREAIKDAGFSHAEISKTPTGTRVALHVTRPGIVIGRKGTGIRALTEKLETDFGLKSPQISVVEIEKPELAPSVMCNRMASHIERGTAFRRATMWTLKQIMEGGAMGVQITVSGKLRGDRSAFEKYTAGILPRAGHHAEIIVDEDIAHVQTAMGLIGIRIRIARKEKLVPEFEMRDKRPKKVKQVQEKEEEKAVKTGDKAVKTSNDEAVKTGDKAVKTSNDKAVKTGDKAVKTSNDDTVKTSNDDTVKTSNDDTVKTSNDKAVKTSNDKAVKTSNDKAVKTGDDTVKTGDEAKSKVKSETEQIVVEEEKMKSIETLEEEEAKLK